MNAIVVMVLAFMDVVSRKRMAGMIVHQSSRDPSSMANPVFAVASLSSSPHCSNKVQSTAFLRLIARFVKAVVVDVEPPLVDTSGNRAANFGFAQNGFSAMILDHTFF